MMRRARRRRLSPFLAGVLWIALIPCLPLFPAGAASSASTNSNPDRAPTGAASSAATIQNSELRIQNSVQSAFTEAFADPAIRAAWARDGGTGGAWGAGPFYTGYEPLDGTPSGLRLVQYFERGRL
jgi:hypothetical protein